MNIGIDIRPIMYGNYTGIGEYTYQLLDHVFKQKTQHDYFLFCNSKKPMQLPAWTAKNVHIDAFSYANKALHVSMLLTGKPQLQSMVEVKRNVKLDKIFLPNQNFFSPRLQDNLTITVHDLSFVRFPKFFTPMHRVWHNLVNLKGLVQKAEQVLAVSEYTKRDLQELWGIDERRIQVIYPGLDPMFFEPSSTKIDGLPEKYILFLGTLEPRKNCEAVIRAFDVLAESDKDLHLVMAGGWGWETKGIKHALATAKHKERIKLLGYVRREDKPALYRQARVLAFPSFYEGFGFPVLEAMSQGCPVVTSTVSSLPEVAGDGALTIAPHDLAGLTEALQSVLDDRQAFDPMVAKAKTRAQGFTWQKAASQWHDVISRV